MKAYPSAKTTGTIADEIRALLQYTSSDHGNVPGKGPWGDKGDLMGLLVRLPFQDAATFRPPDGGGSNDTTPSMSIGGADGWTAVQRTCDHIN